MRYHISALLILTFISTSTFGQNIKKVTPKIDQVTVFLNKAQIASSFSLNIPAGNSKIIIEDIASTIDQNSLQIAGKGDFTLLGMKFRPNYLNSKTTALNDSIKATKAEIENVDLNIAVAANEEKMIMANASIGSEKDGVLPEDLKEMIDFFRANLTIVGKRMLSFKRQRKDLDEKLAKLQNQYNSQVSGKQPLGEIELSVSAAKNTSANISLVYVAASCGWVPNYDIRVKDLKSLVNINYKANVYQNTGIDWNNVKLTLSTSNPNLGNQKPELFPQFLSIYNPVPVYSRSMRKAEEGQEMVMMAAPAPMMADMANVSASVEVVQTSQAVLFELPINYTILSGKDAETVEIQYFSLLGEFKNKMTPKLDNNSFTTVLIGGWEKYNLINGEANVYFEGKYIGKTYINEANVKDNLEVSLGRDVRIVAKREENVNFKSRKTFGSNIKENFSYTITVRNTKSESMSIIVEDQVPVSQDSSIDIEVDELSGGILDKETGKITWDLMVGAAQSKEIVISYTVKYPKDKKINNL